jgi:hypothetical protein
LPPGSISVSLHLASISMLDGVAVRRHRCLRHLLPPNRNSGRRPSGQHCCEQRPEVLHILASLAPNGWRRCYKRLSALLRAEARGATNPGWRRRCFERPAVLLPIDYGVGTSSRWCRCEQRTEVLKSRVSLAPIVWRCCFL